MTHGIFDVRADFGALGDNVADDTAAIQAAIDAANALPEGGVALVPSGRYFTTGLKLRSRVTLQGLGSQSIIRLFPGTVDPLITLASNTETHTTLRDLRLRGNKYNGPQETAHGISLVNTTDYAQVKAKDIFRQHDPAHHRIFNVWVEACAGHGIYLVTSETQLDHFVINECNGIGLYVDSADNWVTNGTINWIGQVGVRLQGGNNSLNMVKAWYIGTDATYAAADAFYVFGHRTRIINCEAQDVSRYALNMDGASNCVIHGLMADNIGNFKKNQNLGYDQPPLPAVRVARYSDPRQARYNSIDFSVGQRSAIPNLSSFIAFHHGTSYNRVSCMGNPAHLAEGGVPVAQPGSVDMHDNIVIYNNVLA